jgi:copper(I)-binding protein
MTSGLHRLLGCLLAIALAAGLHAAAASGLVVSDAWIRWLPADLPAAGYLTIVNTGTVERVLVAVTSPAYGEVGIHRSVDDQGMHSMRPVDSITLKPRVPFRFAEGGYHLMLMHARTAIHPGERVVMTFHFGDGDAVEAVFAVRGSAAAQ